MKSRNRANQHSTSGQIDDIERLRSHALPIVSGIYPQKGKRVLAIHTLPATPNVMFGEGGGLIEMLYAATGFLLVRREVYLGIQRTLELPTGNERFGSPLIPFFLPMIRTIDDGHWYWLTIIRSANGRAKWDTRSTRTFGFDCGISAGIAMAGKIWGVSYHGSVR